MPQFVDKFERDEKMFKKALITAAVAAAVGVPGLTPTQSAMAAEAAAAPPPYTLTGNVGIYSQYIFRGLTQTDRKPALQGGFDFAHESGFYVGTWASNVSWLRDALFAGLHVRWQPRVGLLRRLQVGLRARLRTLDVGTLYYYYPGSANPIQLVPGVSNPKADTWEIYAALSWKWLSAKYSYGLMNETFAVKDCLGHLVPRPDGQRPPRRMDRCRRAHPGRTLGLAEILRFRSAQRGLHRQPSNDTLYSYKDYKIGLTYALPKDFTVGSMYTGTTGLNDAAYGTLSQCTPQGCGSYPSNLGKGTATVFIQKTF